MPDSPRLRRIAALLLSATVGVCALPAAAQSVTVRHDQRARCEMHAVIVRGEISAPAASGASSFSANVWSVRVFALHPGADSALCAGPAMTGAGTTTATASGTAGTGAGTSTCPVPTSGTSGGSSTAVARGVTINTASSTRVMLNGAASNVGSLPRGDHFLAVFLVPACAGDGSSSGLPAIFLAAWPPHSRPPAMPAFAGGRDHHGWWGRDWWRHGGGHHFAR